MTDPKPPHDITNLVCVTAVFAALVFFIATRI